VSGRSSVGGGPDPGDAAGAGDDPFRRLLASVVDGGYCIGCGICAAVEESPLTIAMDPDGAYRPRLTISPSRDAISSRVLEVCPFTGLGPDEDELSAERFAPAAHRTDIGYHLATYAGHVAEGAFRSEGSSGGMASWLLTELLRTGTVDHILQVHPGDGAQDEALFAYGVDGTVEEVARGSRAAYYPVELSAVLAHVREHPGRYAVTGVPCFVKGLRRLARTDPVIDERLTYTIGIICGHLKTAGYAQSLAWQLGVPPDELATIDFRTKLAGRTAREKGVTATAVDGTSPPPRVVQELVGTKYPHGFFRQSACDYCDDVVAETADVAVGDAWLPEYVGSGNSVVVVRRPEIVDLIEAARHAGRLRLDEIAPERAAATQRGGLRDRREGLAYRLLLTRRAGRWHPTKRVEPAARISLPTRLLYRIRQAIPSRSVAAFAHARREGDLEVFLRRMRPWVWLYGQVVRLGRLRERVIGLLIRVGVRQG
jgi:coenzyme F420 hydrogenase subunit beta